jgi:hypothetical protein
MTAASFLAALLPALTGLPARADSTSCQAAVQTFDSLKSYRAVSTTNVGGKPYVSTTDIVLPDRFHVWEKDIELIAIGSKSWQKMNGADWQATPASGTSMDLRPDAAAFRNVGADCSDAGMGAWQGQPAHIFKSSNISERAGHLVSTLYVFSDGYVHHLEIKGADVVTMDFSAFNSATVKPPR